MVTDPLHVEAELEALWGHRTLPRDAGVLHVVATWVDDAIRRVIRITPESPKSDTDFFLLNLARARADVIVTTGRILREEPELRYTLPQAWAGPMLRWRAEAMQRSEPPELLVLTSGQDLDFAHPAFHGWARPHVVTSDVAARALAPTAPPHVDVTGLMSTDLRHVLTWARRRGGNTISVEAGPSTAGDLYQPPIAVDELWLSEFLEPCLAPHLRGPGLFPGDPAAGSFVAASRAARNTERSGRWRFSRLVQGPPASA